ncbi:MerR family transcriptional regulator [Intrasporangium calvum]|uniref:Transcriptional regulator, MerR family n=1 Tax=Intrasporangium calvum (strain ATCC 23552 / DSM 43043 / JCM 3097 / NBRC 12989 / NCIMB 10167 / NRRL B-3866 / 7 KIP) TaxID=710696 RepID=E6SFH7_INTC7|nr:MerR family transcriptional regulator [Intrasporangium calvum]ADU46715.1 transcriptional regulator, MerR family [Intrasporangium calvum DSM 43043]
MYTIKRAAELTGISLSTLRAWERRYGVVSPVRSDGRYRLYSADDLRALGIMAALVNEGWSAREAAAETKARIEGSAQRGGPLSQVDGGPGPRPEASVLPRVDELVAAAGRLDTVAVSDILDEAFSRAGFERVVDDWLMPALSVIGESWADGRISIAGEHLLSHAIQRRLAAAYEAAGARTSGPIVTLGLPPGARHELGVLAFAVALRRAGYSTAYLGADLPAGDWGEAVAARGATAVVLAVPRAADVVPARQVCEELLAAHPDLVVFVGGGRQDEVGAGSVPLGHDMRTAVEAVDSALNARRPA